MPYGVVRLLLAEHRWARSLLASEMRSKRSLALCTRQHMSLSLTPVHPPSENPELKHRAALNAVPALLKIDVKNSRGRF